MSIDGDSDDDFLESDEEDDISEDIEYNLEDQDEEESDERNRSNLVRAALETQLLEYASRRSEQKRNLDELTCFIEEFLDSFIVIGYNFDGEPITLVSATTQQQADSLGTLLQKFIVNSGQGKGPGGIL